MSGPSWLSDAAEALGEDGGPLALDWTQVIEGIRDLRQQRNSWRQAWSDWQYWATELLREFGRQPLYGELGDAGDREVIAQMALGKQKERDQLREALDLMCDLVRMLAPKREPGCPVERALKIADAALEKVAEERQGDER